ncbi:Polyketide cyclase / dehydrase and lipid transport [Streptomyces sp. S4.7]|uniref:SRPBCC family protein n=1 Tax=Streptomyces sp. S4.7 TaxID=2705439 RepID=UPI001397750A|nr:SRPBCC family protein [Streptomyces sp. S4.7]QHY99735.1 Polyketide cyclase / dehydrase and lipid transport [Streptomyces sp. S4.7]
MAKQTGKPTDTSASGLDQVKEQLSAYVGARGQKLLDSAGGKLTDVAQGLGGGSDGGGSNGLLDVGKRVLGGENPVKALVGEKAGSMKDKAVDSVKSAFGGGDAKAGSAKVTNIIEAIDVGKPLRTVYDRWTEIEEFNSFAKGVTDVKQSDEIESDWKLKVAFSNRSWKATVQEQVADDRIVWTSEGAKGTTHGAITFHELAPSLTRIVAVVEYTPSGFFEKTGNIWRAQGRRLRLDLKHFQRYATLTDDEEVEGWRGEIREGEVVRSHEEGLEDDEPEEEEGEEEEDEGPEEPEDEADDDYDEEEEEADEEEPDEEDEEQR